MKEFLNVPAKLWAGALSTSSPTDNHEIPAGQPVLHMPKGLPANPLNLIPLNSISGLFAHG